MAARFIGAGPGRGRRRRRLVLSNSAGESSSPSSTRRPVAAEANASAVPEPTRVVTTFNSLIRPQPWINWLIVAAGFALWVGVIHWGWTIDHSGSGLKDVLGLSAGRVTRFFAATCLFAATQLSLVILWYRTQSRKDFQGRYRVWIWSCFTWAALASAAISGWHLTVSQSLASRWSGRLGSASQLLWLLPAAMLVGTTCRLLSREVASTRANRWLLRLAVLIGGIVFLLEADLGFVASEWAGVLKNACVSLWALLTASVLLHQARYVIHVSNEVLPRERHPGRLSPIIQQVWAEVLALGPSRRTIIRFLEPRRIWQGLKFAGGLARDSSIRFYGALARLRGRGLKSTDRAAKRRKESAPLPSPAIESRSKAAGKSAAKAAKPV